MTRAGLNRIFFILPLIFSALACAMVIGSLIAGVPPQPDEDAGAHIWQLLMVTQIPLVAAFVATADWRTPSPALFVGIQVAAMSAACLPVWLGGY